MNAQQDPDALATAMCPELILTDWTPTEAPAGAETAWRGDGGEVLTVFAPDPQTPDELLAADTASLLAGGTFVPDRPLREGDHLHGTVTAAAARGPARLDVRAVAGDDGTRRVVLLRPVADARG